MTNSNPVSTPGESSLSRERRDLLETLRAHRGFLCQTASGLTDDQARQRSTVSALTVGGLIRHVAETERGWAQFMSGAGLPGSDVAVDWSNVRDERLAQGMADFRSHFEAEIAPASQQIGYISAALTQPAR